MSISKTIFYLAALIFFLWFSVVVNAQDSDNIDSLKAIISSAKNDTIKLAALIKLNEVNQNRNELKKGFGQQILLAKKLKKWEAACMAYSELAYFEYENGNYIAAEKYTTEGMQLAKEKNELFAIGRLSNWMMMISNHNNDFPAAIRYLKQGEELFLKVNKPVNLTRLYCNASEVFKLRSMNANALEYARRAYHTAKSCGEAEPLATATWFLANRLQLTGKYDSSIYYYQQDIYLEKQLGSLYGQGDIFMGLSDVYVELKQYKTARAYLEKAIAKYDLVKVTDRKLVCEEMLTNLNFMNKDFDKVKAYVLSRKNKPIEDTLTNNRFVYKWLANLALINGDVGEWKNNYSSYEKAVAALTNNQIQQQLLELETKYAVSEKENELLQKDTENRKRLWIIAALMLGVLSLSLIAITQYRNYQNKQKIAQQNAIIEKQHALEEERLRIAADMHDDVGAGLSRIRYITTTMKEGRSISHDDMDKILSLSDESVEKMNEIIWSLNQGNQQLEELIYHIRGHCAAMVSNANKEFVYTLPAHIPTITLDWRQTRNIYLLAKEAVNNAIKHSHATVITIECSIDTQLHLSIADNGSGFDPDNIKKNGNGLLNFKKRINELLGSYELHTAAGLGTVIRLDIPLNA